MILIILQIRRGYTVSVRSNHKLIMRMGIVNMVQIQTWLPVVLLRIPISPIIISIVMLPPNISHISIMLKVTFTRFMQFTHIFK